MIKITIPNSGIKQSRLKIHYFNWGIFNSPKGQDILDSTPTPTPASGGRGSGGGGGGVVSYTRPTATPIPTPVITPTPTAAPILTGSNNAMVELTDLGNVEWASDAIRNLTSLGVVEGYYDKTFRPNENITREAYIKMNIDSKF